MVKRIFKKYNFYNSGITQTLGDEFCPLAGNLCLGRLGDLFSFVLSERNGKKLGGCGGETSALVTFGYLWFLLVTGA